MGNSNGTVGRLDPVTGLITEYPTQARDPHTGVFHPNGKLFFTAQHSGMLGRLDPKTGVIDEITTRARPYGIKVGNSGKLYIAYNGTNAIGELDPDTLDIRYFEVPDERTRIRRLDIASDGSIWFVNSSLGALVYQQQGGNCERGSRHLCSVLHVVGKLDACQSLKLVRFLDESEFVRLTVRHYLLGLSTCSSQWVGGATGSMWRRSTTSEFREGSPSHSV